jgi:hypothetical protein
MTIIYRGPRSSEFSSLLKSNGIKCNVSPKWESHHARHVSEDELWLADSSQYPKAGKLISDVISKEKSSKDLKVRAQNPCLECNSSESSRTHKPIHLKILNILTLSISWLFEPHGHWRKCLACKSRWFVKDIS